MDINLLRLKNGIDKCVDINIDYSFSKDELKGTDLLELDNVHIEGEITLNALKELYLNLVVSGVMVLPCAVTLKPVHYPFNIVIDGDLTDIDENYDENDKKHINSIDILPIIWENILMEIPMRVVSEDAKLEKTSGDGWRLITDEEGNINSELAGLKDLLQDSEVR